jgi:hypothetical protein
LSLLALLLAAPGALDASCKTTKANSNMFTRRACLLHVWGVAKVYYCGHSSVAQQLSP